MEIAGIEIIRNLAEEYGWTDAQIEMALSTAIRLCYLEQGMLAEVDVNLEQGTIAARRRNGAADRGVWVDIQKPLMPNVKMLVTTMEMMQWGDGSPGRILEGVVSGYRDGGIIYRVLDNMVFVPQNLMSVMDYHTPPPLGSEQVLALCASRDEKSGLRTATRRGKEFVAAVMECYYPDCVSDIWMGASNSWAVIRMSSEDVSVWLENGGVNVKHLQQVLGIRRITLIPEGDGETEQEVKDNELRHFINNAWKDCKIEELSPQKIVLHTPFEHNDPRKLRTFTSMLKKIAPEREQHVF